MKHETATLDQGTTRYDYHLSAEMPIIGVAKTYSDIHQHVWFDLHAEVEFGIVLRGRTQRMWGNTLRILGPGDVWFCGVFERHGYRIIEPPCQVVALIISPDAVADLFFTEAPTINWLGMFTAPLAQRPHTTDAQRPHVIDIGRRLWRNCRGKHTYTPSLLRRLLLVEALHLLAGTQEDQHTASRRSKGAYARIAPAIELALQAHTLVTNEQAATTCGLSRDQFIRGFRQMLGISFADFALRRRLQGAKLDLSYTDLPIKAIARNWGFTDHSHLHRLFTEHFQCAPSDLRRS